MNFKQASEELDLNIKHQNIDRNKYLDISYFFEEGKGIANIMIPILSIKIKNEEVRE